MASKMKSCVSEGSQESDGSKWWIPGDECSWTLLPPDAPHMEIVGVLS